MDKYRYRYRKLLNYSALVFIGGWLYNNPDFHLIGHFVIVLTLILLFNLLVLAVAEDCLDKGFNFFRNHYNDKDNNDDNDNDNSYRIVIFLKEKDDDIENNDDSINDDNSRNDKTKTNEDEP